jgi:hypothetical protein
MIRVTIGQDAKVDSDISSAWITDQVNKKRAAAGRVPVRVQIDEDRVHLTLATPAAADAGAAGASRPLTTDERKLMNNWAKFHLDTDNFAASELAAFVQPFIH